MRPNDGQDRFHHWHRRTCVGVTVGLLLLVAVAPAVSREPAPVAGTLASFEAVAEACLADAERLDPTEVGYARYLSAPGGMSADQIRKLGSVLAFHANSLSTEAVIVRPVAVAPGVWRIQADDYGWKPGIWDKLAEVDPYWHVRAVVSETTVEFSWVESTEWPGEVWLLYHNGRQVGAFNKLNGTYHALLPNGNYGPTATSPYPFGQVVRQSTSRTVATPTWAGSPGTMARLIALTGSQAPIYRADWWFAQTAISANRVAGYYDFLGLGKKQADFDKFIGDNPDAAAKRRTEIGDAVRRSVVTHRAREIYRRNTFYGTVWVTRDFDSTQDNKAPEDRDNNPLRLLDGKARFAATEQLATLPNGLLVAWLANAAGERQDRAPDVIASARNMVGYHGTDQEVHAGTTFCFGCHSEGGLRPIDGWVRSVYFDTRSPLQLLSPDVETRRRNRQIYQQDLIAALEEGRVKFRRAVKECSGYTAEQNSAALLWAWEWYVEKDRSLERFAAELYVTPERLTAVLMAEAAKGNLDPVLASLLARQSLRWDDAEQAFGLAMGLMGRAGP